MHLELLSLQKVESANRIVFRAKYIVELILKTVRLKIQ
jgi:hypothetical protein